MIIINDSYFLHPDTLRGRKPKFKLSKNGKYYIYKFGSINNEILAELIAEQLGIQVGIKMAHYKYAACQDTKGVLTDYFLEPQELIISSDNLRENAQKIIDENNLNQDLRENTITNIVTAATIYDDRVIPEELTRELMLRWCFYGLIMESDKNATNIAFVKGPNPLSLTPDYDNSSMAGLNRNIANFIDALRYGQSIYGYIDGFKTALKITTADTGNFPYDFSEFVKNQPELSEYCIKKVNQINLEEAFETVESINGIEIPWNVKFWITKAVTARLQDMNHIYNSNTQDKANKIFEKTNKKNLSN